MRQSRVNLCPAMAGVTRVLTPALITIVPTVLLQLMIAHSKTITAALSISIFYSSPTQCVKYQTDQLQDVKKLEKLNNILMRHMVSKSS